MARRKPSRVRFECSVPILRVANMKRSVRYYVKILGFKNAPWGNQYFTGVSRGKAHLYLCQGSQGRKGTWAWIGVGDVAALHLEYKRKGAKIRHSPRNFPWAYEMKVGDPDGHVLRFGCEPLKGKPFDPWHD